MVVLCWLVIHTSAGKTDFRAYKQFKGYVMHETSDFITANFFDTFKKAHIDLDFNSPVQILRDAECTYGL